RSPAEGAAEEDLGEALAHIGSSKLTRIKWRQGRHLIGALNEHLRVGTELLQLSPEGTVEGEGFGYAPRRIDVIISKLIAKNAYADERHSSRFSDSDGFRILVRLENSLFSLSDGQILEDIFDVELHCAKLLIVCSQCEQYHLPKMIGEL